LPGRGAAGLEAGGGSGCAVGGFEFPLPQGAARG